MRAWVCVREREREGGVHFKSRSAAANVNREHFERLKFLGHHFLACHK